MTALLGLTSCQENNEPEEAVEGLQTKLTDEEFASIGYLVKERGETKQSEWDKGQFGQAAVTFTHIRSTTETRPGSQTYPRFKIIRERYLDADAAEKRFKRLRDFDPALTNKFKNTDHDLRRGFYVDDEVVIVTTDAVLFSRHYLDGVTAELKKLHQVK